MYRHDPHTPAATSVSPDAVAALVAWFEQLTPASLSRLECHYAADACFKDPFNEVQGLPAIARVFERMFADLLAPRFIVTQQVVQGAHAFLTWEFRFHYRRWRTDTEQCVRGATHFVFNPQGRVVWHRDYWDAAEELYETWPLLGPLMRALRRRVSH